MTQPKRPLIIVTNDDGIHAPGLRFLISCVKPLGDLLIVAPDKPQSAMGHAVTIQTPLRLHLISESAGYTEYSSNGTPADCVKLAQKVLMRDKPDLIVSGVNHGSNASINILYSGTMAAVLEGAMENVPAIGFSLNDYRHDADFSHCADAIHRITTRVLLEGLPDGICLNVNLPKTDGQPPKGIRITRQARAYWDEHFDERKDPHQRDYFWLKGDFRLLDEDDDTDYWAINQGYVSVSPVQIDLTAYTMMPILKDWGL